MAKLGEYNRWFRKCENCGYDTGRASQKSNNKCWKCGQVLKRDFSKRALKINQKTGANNHGE